MPTAESPSPQSDGPVLYAMKRRVPLASPGTRLIALGVAVGCLAVLITAASLTPSPTGVASHKGLGLQSCALLERSSIPCPSCGMTTSFAWFARGNIVASFYVQPMGTLLALAAAGCVWAGAYIAISGRPIHRLLTILPAGRLLIYVLGFFIAAWGWKTAIQLGGWDGWR